MAFSMHSHSGQFCAHGQGSLESMVLSAIQLGLRKYGLSEHMPRFREEDLYPDEVGDNPCL
jgi:histidinol-phosphatase (PHP family)